jgi:cell division protein FtsW (lipid II flippase)
MFTPEHLHVALNHVALIGFAVAMIPLLIALLRKDRGALLSGLLIVLICGLSIPVVMETGEEATERIITGKAGVELDSATGVFLHEHEERAELAAVFVYIVTGLAAAGLLVMRIKPQHQYKLAVLVLAGCIICTALLVWTAEAGGRIRHPEFRPAVSAP